MPRPPLDATLDATLDDAQVDRAVGAVLASATGDALGVPYEFGSASYPGCHDA